MSTKKNRRAPRAARPRRANPPPRKGALIEVERRDGAYWFRHPMGHLAGPHRSRAAAMDAGARAFAAALNPAATRAELTELAAALMEEDPERPYVRQFADGWRVWDPARRIFLRGPNGAPFATRGEAERRRRELAGEDADDGPMFRRAAPALDLFAPRPARGGGGAPMQQLGLFGARENPGPLEYFSLTEAGVNEAGRLVYEGLQRLVAEQPGLALKGHTRKGHGPYRRAHDFDLTADWIEKNPLLPPSPDFAVMVTTNGVWVESREGRGRMAGETPAEQADAALRAVRGWIKRSSRRPNPSGNPSRGLQSRAQRAVEHVESVLGGVLDGLSRIYGPTVPSVATVTWPSAARVAKLLALDVTGMEQMVAGAEIRVRAVSPSGQPGVVARSVAVALDAKGTYAVLYMRKGKTGAKTAQAKLALVDGIGHAAGDAVAAFFAKTPAPVRENPSTALGPLRGGPGEAVVYRPRGDGTVIVRASHAGAGASEREMTLAGALEHRARLLRMGYRTNPSRRPAKARKATAKRRSARRTPRR
jgi:hypothetical protein